MNPALLQKQLKDNAADLNDFYKDLKTWGEDMKRKEESQKNSTDSNLPNDKGRASLPKKKKKLEPNEKQSKTKIGYTDYTAWDKFDADAECEKVDYDDNEESDLTDECDDTARDAAYLEKEKGNKFVKDKKWDEAIECYTKAIDFYPYDPVFYANRALCFLKKGDYVKVESDCTMSLKLDATYVKAFQRRAAAREALNKLDEARSDLMKVLELEPKNKESLSSFDVLQKKLQIYENTNDPPRPISKFTASRNKSNVANSTYSTTSKATSVKSESWSDADAVIPVKAVAKPVSLQSKKPLKRISIREISGLDENPVNTQLPFPRATEYTTTLKTDDLKIIEKQPHNDVPEMTKETKNHTNNIKMNETQMELCAPKNSVQFHSQWRHLKTIDNKYAFLKLIKPQDLPTIFKESLESGTFSEILEVLVTCFIKNNDEVFDFLKFFPVVRRFSTIVLFLTDADKKYMWKLFDYVRQSENHAKEEVDLVLKKYEL